MEPVNLSKSIQILSVEFLPPARTKLREMRSLFVELQSYWLEYGFSVADTIANDRCWEIMKQITNLLPRKDSPVVTGCDLEPLQNQPEAIRDLFLSQSPDLKAFKAEDSVYLQIDIAEFKPCQILEYCCFNGAIVLVDAEQMMGDRETEKAQSRDLKVVAKIGA